MNVAIGVLFGIFLISNLSFAQSAQEVLDLKAVIRLAYQHHPDMVQARAALKSAQGELITSRSLADPEVEVEFGDETSFEVRQPLPPLGAGLLKAKIARNDVSLQQQHLQSVWAFVYTKVRQSYADVLVADKEMELAHQNLESMRQFFGKVQVRYESGSILKNELQRAKIELLKTENNLLESQTRLKESKAQLNMAIGRSIDADVEIKEQLNEEELDLDFDQIKKAALEHRPDIKMAALNIDSAKAKVVQEQLSRLPSYFIGLKKQDESSKKDYAFLLGFSIPIWNLNQGEVKKAKANQELQEAMQSTVLNRALLEIYSAFWDVELRKQQLGLFKTSLQESHELLRLAHMRYSEGKIDFLNYLDQVSTSLQVKTDYYKGLLNYSQSISRLEAAINGSLRGEDGFHEKP